VNGKGDIGFRKKGRGSQDTINKKKEGLKGGFRGKKKGRITRCLIANKKSQISVKGGRKMGESSRSRQQRKSDPVSHSGRREQMELRG